MPTVQQAMEANIDREALSPVSARPSSATGLPGMEPTFSAFLLSPLPNLNPANPDNLRQFYRGGQVPQMRILQPILTGAAPVSAGTTIFNTTTSPTTVTNITQTGVSPYLTFSVEGSLQADPYNPAGVHILPSTQTASGGWIAQVSIVDPSIDTVVQVRRTPAGSSTPAVVATLTIPAGATTSAAAGGAFVGNPLDTIDIVIVSCSGVATPVNLIVRPA